MTLHLYYHPLASFCWKVLIALYENGTPFTPHIIDLADESERRELEQLWPMAKFPVLRDDVRHRSVPESSLIIEYLARHYPGPVHLLPEDTDLAFETRLRDRFYDLYVHDPMQRIVADRLRPADKRDPYGVAQQKAVLDRAYAAIDGDMAAQRWAANDSFSMADCAATPALYYANRVHPIGDERRPTAQYLARLVQRPAFARVFEEAQPYFKYFPE